MASRSMSTMGETMNRSRPNTGWEYLGFSVQAQTLSTYSTVKIATDKTSMAKKACGDSSWISSTVPTIRATAFSVISEMRNTSKARLARSSGAASSSISCSLFFIGWQGRTGTTAASAVLHVRT